MLYRCPPFSILPAIRTPSKIKPRMDFSRPLVSLFFNSCCCNSWLHLTLLYFLFLRIDHLCSVGTMSPTTAPNFLLLNEYGEGCPNDYTAFNNYDAGDIVSYYIDPDRKFVYQCKVRRTISLWAQLAYFLNIIYLTALFSWRIGLIVHSAM